MERRLIYDLDTDDILSTLRSDDDIFDQVRILRVRVMAEDIKINGQRRPIIIHGRKVLDGAIRVLALIKLCRITVKVRRVRWRDD